MVRGFLYLAGMLGTLYLALLYQGESILLLFFLELILPGLLLAVYLPCLLALKIRLDVPIPVAEEGQKVGVKIIGENHVFVSGAQLKVQIRIENAQGKERTVFWGKLPEGNSKRRLRTEPGTVKMQGEFIPEMVGQVRIIIDRVWLMDPFGVWKIPLPKRNWGNSQEVILVLPKLVSVPVYVSRQSRDFVGESEYYSKKSGGDDPAEVFQIRNYRSGDLLRSIHWKLSAKENDLMVREQSRPLGCPVLLFLKREENRGRKTGRRQRRMWNAFVQIVGSVSSSLAEEKCRHYVIWYDETQHDIMRYCVKAPSDVYAMLLQICRGKGSRMPVDLKALYTEKYHELNYVTELSLDMDLQLYGNGNLLGIYQYSHLEEDLKRLEVLV